MATYNVSGWIWAGTGSMTTLQNVIINDNDPNLSPYFTNDFSETIEIGGTVYTNPRAGTYQMTFTDSGGTVHTEDLLLFSTGSNFIFVPLPGSAFDTDSVVNSLGGWQDYTSGFSWASVTCFTRGVELTAPSGPRLVETIKKGDVLVTKDSGLQTVKWVGSKTVVFSQLSDEVASRLRPVRISAGALGCGLPVRDLLVSQQHRILVQSKICMRMFGENRAFVSAKNLTELPGIFIDEDVKDVEYFHVLFDKHEIVFAEGTASESFYTGPEALKTVSFEARDEIFNLFPELKTEGHIPDPAALIPKAKLQRKLVGRHAKNQKPLSPVDLRNS